jgi:hypothetical protein
MLGQKVSEKPLIWVIRSLLNLAMLRPQLLRSGALTFPRPTIKGCTSGFGSRVAFRVKEGNYRIVVGDAGGARENTFTLKVQGP